MKNRYKVLVTLIIFLSLSCYVPTSLAWDDCPFGIDGDSFPGLCGRYIDTNDDNICDRSQEEPSTMNTSPSSESAINAENQSNTAQIFHGKSLLENENILYLIISFLIVLFLAIDSYILGKKNRNTKIKIRILWNIFLLIVFIPSAITGILIILFPNFPSLLTLDANFIKLHTISSFFFMWISAYHIIWHTSYYLKSARNLLKQT